MLEAGISFCCDAAQMYFCSAFVAVGSGAMAAAAPRAIEASETEYRQNYKSQWKDGSAVQVRCYATLL